MKYDSDNFSMAFLYDIAGLLSASHLLAHLLVDRTKKHLGLCSQTRQVLAISAARVAHCLIWPSSSAFLTRGNHFSDYSCHPINTCLPLMLSLLFVCKTEASSIFIPLREMRFNMSRQSLFHKAVWSSPLLRQRQSASYVKLLARSVHTEQLPPTTPVRPVCLSSRIKDMY